MDQPDAATLDAFAALQAKALGIPLDAADPGEVRANLAVAFRMAQMVLSFPLPDEADPAPVFDPLAKP